MGRMEAEVVMILKAKTGLLEGPVFCTLRLNLLVSYLVKKLDTKEHAAGQ